MSKVRFCSHCGHPLPDEGVLAVLSPLEGRLFEIVRRAGQAGVKPRDAMEALYSNARDGGPESNTIISVMKHNINQKIAEFDIEIHANRGMYAHYKLRPK